MSELYLISPSQFRAHKECEEKHYYVYSEGLRPKQTEPHFAVGSYFHELAHFYFQLLASGYKVGDPHTEAAMDTKMKNDLENVHINYASIVIKVHLMFRLYLKRRTKTIDSGLEIVEVEKNIEYVFPGTNIGIHGIVDLIYRKHGKLVIRDHKTGENKSAHSDESLIYEDQLLTYAVIIWLLYDEVPAIEISWVNSKTIYSKPPTDDQLYGVYYKALTKADVEAWLTYTKQYIYRMQSVPPIISMSAWKCKRCMFKDVCTYKLKGIDTGNLIQAQFKKVPRNHDYAKFTEIARKNPGGNSVSKVDPDNPTGGGITLNFSKRGG